jgi:DNA-binding transcriptional LysR family regulator
MTLEQLAAFQAVAQRGTFAAASQHLHKSQPAVTKLVQNLEAELGLALFDRSAYRATLTDAGRLFLERTRQLLDQTEALRGFGLTLANAAEPVLRLVIAHKQSSLGEALEAQPFRAVRILPVARHDHPLARVDAPVPGALLRQYAQVVLRDSGRGELKQNVNVLEGGLRWSVTDVAAKLEIIHAGMGWGGLPEHVVAPALRDGSLRALEIREFDVRVIELQALRRKVRVPGPVAEALWSRLRRCADAG